MRILSSPEIKVLVNELKVLVGAHVNKIYQPSREEVLFKLRREGGYYFLKNVVGKALFLTEYKKTTEKFPPHFCMFLRKYLGNSVIRSIRQLGFERIIEVEFFKGESFFLVFELFSKGNIIILNSERNILLSLKPAVFESRSLLSGQSYKQPPPLGPNVFTLSFEQFNKVVTNSSKESIVKCLASDLALGKLYSEEVLARAEVDKNAPIHSISSTESKLIYTQLMDMISLILNSEVKPVVFISKEGLSDFAPFEMISANPRLEKKYFDSLNSCLDFIYSGWEHEAVVRNKLKQFEDRYNKIKGILDEQVESKKLYEEKSEEFKKKGDLVYSNYSTIESILNALLGARRGGKSWLEIQELIELEKGAGVPEALAIKELRHDESIIVLSFGEEELEFDFTLKRKKERR